MGQRREECFREWQEGKKGDGEQKGKTLKTAVVGGLQDPWAAAHVACTFAVALQMAGPQGHGLHVSLMGLGKDTYT